MKNRLSLQAGIAFLIGAAGIGLCGYAGVLWRELPRYTEADLQASTELNLAVDLARKGRSLDSKSVEQLRHQVRTEIEKDLAEERRAVLPWLLVGLCLIGLGFWRAYQARNK